MTRPLYTPPVLLHPDRSADAGLVRKAFEKLRPDVVVLVGDKLGSCLSGLPVMHCRECAGTGCLLCTAQGQVGGEGHLGPCECAACGGSGRGPRFTICEPDPALRAIWTAGQEGKLVQAAAEGLTEWARRRPCYGAESAFRALAGYEYAAVREHHADWALVIAAGCKDGVWRRHPPGLACYDQKAGVAGLRGEHERASVIGNLSSPYHDSGDPEEVNLRLFPRLDQEHIWCSELGYYECADCAMASKDLPVKLHTEECVAGWRQRAEATQAWIQTHVEAVDDLVPVYLRAVELAVSDTPTLVLLDGNALGPDKLWPLLKHPHVAACVWTDDESIDKWAPLGPGTLIDCPGSPRMCGGWQPCAFNIRNDSHQWPRRANGITWIRREDNSWLGLSAHLAELQG